MRMRRGIDVKQATRREILRKQMELLAEDSLKPGMLAKNSRVIVQINQELNKPVRALFLVIVIMNFFIYTLVFVKKFFWSKSR